MKTKFILLSLITILILAFKFTDDENTMIARELVQDFGIQLKSELMSGMKKGGATEAIAVCNSKAPQIAKQLSDSTGWKIGRTSLKVRNSNNVPDDWEKSVLENFEKKLQDGQNIKTLEYSEIVKIEDSEYFRYMKGIPTGGVCLNCHGSNIKESIKEKISELYDDDKAINYKKGDLRGAFTLSKKIN